MAENNNWLQQLRQETDDIIAQLREDGSDPDALYEIEHHFSSTDFDSLEKLAVEAFRLGYEVLDPEEVEEEGELLFSCDVIRESALQAEVINTQVEQLYALAEKMEVEYDGWGTYFIGDEDEEDDDSQEEEG